VKILYERYARFIRDRAGHGRALAEHFAALAAAGDREPRRRGLTSSRSG
jgi:hypothetical protein